MAVGSPSARFALGTALLLMACGGKAEEKKPVLPKPIVSNRPTPAPPRPGANATVSFKEKQIEFDYSWPQEAVNIPKLDAWLRSNAERLRKETVDSGRAEIKSAKEGGYMMNGYSYEEHWRTVANVPALLVMQSEGYAYSNGAHGMPVVTALFWDKAAQKRLATGAIFDLATLKQGINQRFCKALDAERAKRRGAPVDPNDPNELDDFVKCVDLVKQTILPVSRRGKALDTLRVVIMPYEAGPYAEGIYELDLPVDAVVMRAVKPAYKAAFAVGK